MSSHTPLDVDYQAWASTYLNYIESETQHFYYNSSEKETPRYNFFYWSMSQRPRLSKFHSMETETHYILFPVWRVAAKSYISPSIMMFIPSASVHCRPSASCFLKYHMLFFGVICCELCCDLCWVHCLVSWFVVVLCTSVMHADMQVFPGRGKCGSQGYFN